MSTSRALVRPSLDEISLLHAQIVGENDSVQKNSAILTFIEYYIQQPLIVISTSADRVAFACLRYLIGLTDGTYIDDQVTPDTMHRIRTFIATSVKA